ncbi:MAG: RnfH family protein [Buchnera aphidicola (Nurudea shiraii)]
MKPIKVLVVYALKNKQYIKKIKLKDKVSVKEAIIFSKILDLIKININNNNVGIYGEIVNLKDLVNNGDRIEIYRPLLVNPRELRRRKMLLKNKK